MNTNYLSEETKISTRTEPLLLIKKLDKNCGNNDNVKIGICFNPSSGKTGVPHTKSAQTPVFNSEKQKFFNDLKKAHIVESKKNSDALFYSTSLKNSPLKNRRKFDDSDGLSKSKLSSMVSPTKRKIKNVTPIMPISTKNYKNPVQSSKKAKKDVKPLKKRPELSSANDFRSSTGFTPSFHDSAIHLKKENLKKASFGPKTTKQFKEATKKSDMSAGRIDLGMEITSEVSQAFKKDSRNNKPVFRSTLIRLS